MHLPSHNPTCYKYNTRKSKVCKLDFLRPTMPNLEIDSNGTIRLRQDNVWVNPWNQAIALLILSNHNINFILSSIKALGRTHYITNYVTGGNCSQYQRVMAVAIVRKAFDNHDKDLTSTSVNYILTLDKFTLKAFNQLSHNWEISGPLVASYLLHLPDHYSQMKNLKMINIALLQAKFLLILNSQNFNQSNNIMQVDGSKVWPCSIYEHYAYRGFAFNEISIYKYLQFVFIMKQSQQQGTDYKFDAGHKQRGDFVQRPLKHVKQLLLVVLYGNLSENDQLEDMISERHPKTNACCIDPSLIFLSLFVP